MKKRVILIVLDSAGIGAMPDAHEFGDEGTNTIGNIHNTVGLNVPNMLELGLASIEGSSIKPYDGELKGSYGKAAEMTHAKDTVSGHWEIAGYIMNKPQKTFPEGFPDELINEFEKRIGAKILGNCVASGTEIINRLGDEHCQSGYPIVYTSADSVFQVAAHEEVIPLERHYEICRTARELLVGDYLVGRVIARPFLGTTENYYRTENRKDYSIEPEEDTILDGLSKLGKTTVAIGKIEDIFNGRGIDIKDHTRNNKSGIDATIKYIEQGKGSFIFTNLVDFDMLYGHRNDPEGYARALEYFDSRLPEIISAMQDDDLLIITADHGCDPTALYSTDHSREYIPILIYSNSFKGGVSIGTRLSFADIGATVYDYLTGTPWKTGKSFLKDLK